MHMYKAVMQQGFNKILQYTINVYNDTLLKYVRLV